MDKPLYQDQYCEKHDQWYADFLHKCPVCRGEAMDGYVRGTIEMSFEVKTSNRPRLVKRPKLVKRTTKNVV